jgi:hypothetical protein
MDNNLKWYMPDGSQFEWDGTWGYSFVSSSDYAPIQYAVLNKFKESA